MKFLPPKQCVSWTVIYFILNLSPNCDYTSIKKENFLSKPYTIHIHTWIHEGMGQELYVCGSYVINSILTVFYQKNKVELG